MIDFFTERTTFDLSDLEYRDQAPAYQPEKYGGSRSVDGLENYNLPQDDNDGVQLYYFSHLSTNFPNSPDNVVVLRDNQLFC